MRMSVRYAVLIAAAGCFLAMTSGFVLYLHLHIAHHGDHQCDHDPLHHDSEHCSFCQQLLVSMKGLASAIESPQISIVESGQTVEVHLGAPPPQTSVYGLHARAPPA